MMKMNFDAIIDRRIPGDVKYAPISGRSDILPLWVADMDFRAPECVEKALTEQAKRGVFGYQYPDAEYDEGVCAWQKKRHDWEISPEWLLKAPGVMFAAAAAIRALTAEDDGVLIFEPVYPPFARVIKSNHRRIVVSELQVRDNRYEIDFTDVERLLANGQVRALLFCSPHNPVGRVWTEDELRQLSALCLRYSVYIISDEIHADFVYAGSRHIPLALLSPELADCTVTCTAPTKTFNLASLQVSNMIIPNARVRHAVKSQIYAAGYSNINSMAIAACKAVYREGEEWLEALLRYLDENRRILREAFSGDSSIRIRMCEGTYLAWLDCHALGLDDKALNEKLLYTAGVRLNEGISFGRGGSGFTRLNFACPHEVLREAVARIKTIE